MEWQAAWLLRAVTVIDLTTLSGDDTETNVKRLCFKAKNPIRSDILKALGMEGRGITTGAVCVYPSRVPDAVKHLKGSGVPIASVAAGFPAGQTPMEQRLQEIERAVELGATGEEGGGGSVHTSGRRHPTTPPPSTLATSHPLHPPQPPPEIDIVITRPLVLGGQWEELYDEVKAMRKACKHAHLKTILATGELGTLDNVYKASMICMMAGADVIKVRDGGGRVKGAGMGETVMAEKRRSMADAAPPPPPPPPYPSPQTSTGKEGVNATFPVAITMLRAIREYYQLTGQKVRFFFDFYAPRPLPLPRRPRTPPFPSTS